MRRLALLRVSWWLAVAEAGAALEHFATERTGRAQQAARRWRRARRMP